MLTVGKENVADARREGRAARWTGSRGTALEEILNDRAPSGGQSRLTVGSLFSGIGGLDLGLERAGMRVLWQCESDPYCRAVLRKHWPDVPCYEDVKALVPDAIVGPDVKGVPQPDQRALAGCDGAGDGRVAAVDVLAGGFPCQPVSLAGRRRGAADERWLWPEFARLIRVLRPRYALMENVPGLFVGGGMAEVLRDLAESGYDAEWDCIPAAAVGAPHLRYRVFIVAYSQRPRLEERQGVGGDSRPEQPTAERDGNAIPDPSRVQPGRAQQRPQRQRARARGESVALANAEGDARELRAPSTERSGRSSGSGDGVADADFQPSIWTSVPRGERHPWLTEPDVGRVAHGVPSRVDRLRALGNAVVPQVAEYVGRQIMRARLVEVERSAVEQSFSEFNEV